MSKTIEVKEIAQYEETDSILAKNTIGRLTNEVRTAYDRGYCDCSRHDRDILERKHQQLEHIEQVNKKLYERIDKAIEYLKDNACYENTISELFCDDLDTDSCMELLDILRGKDE